jgi:hypothetical protein
VDCIQLFQRLRNFKVFKKNHAPLELLRKVAFTQWHTQEFFRRVGRGSTNSVDDRGQKQGSGGGSPLVRGSGGSHNLVQEISFHTVNFS